MSDETSIRLFVAALVLVMVLKLVSVYCDQQTRRQYCGPVVERIYSPAGYRVEASQYVVIHSDELGRNLVVPVSLTTYGNCPQGSRQCFNLTNSELYR